jgi:hypothetical protein
VADDVLPKRKGRSGRKTARLACLAWKLEREVLMLYDDVARQIPKRLKNGFRFNGNGRSH